MACRRVLIIDNYDSFTYNLAHRLARLTGELPLVARNDELSLEAIARLDVDCVVVSPGPGTPAEPADMGICLELIRELPRPCLGVCLGHQAIGFAFGARIVRAGEPMHGRVSPIEHGGDALYAGIPQGFRAVRYHSLLVASDLPESLARTAWTPGGLLMGLKHRERPLWGVQFHPESIGAELGDRLLANFLELAGRQRGAARSAARSGAAAAPARSSGSAPRRFRVHAERVGAFVDPERVFVELFSGEPDAFWLDRQVPRRDGGSASYMGGGAGPHAFVVSCRAGSGEVELATSGAIERRRGALFDVLGQLLCENAIEASELGCDFQGGFVGYLGYELNAECGGQRIHASELPDARLAFVDRFLAFLPDAGEVYAVALSTAATRESAAGWVHDTARRVRELGGKGALGEPARAAPVELRLLRSKAEYCAQIRECQELIRSGESFEICLTSALAGAPIADPLPAYRALRRRSPVAYGAFLRFGESAVLSASPEQFLRVESDGRVTSRPIKGTRPRGESPAADARLRRELAESEKERAENLMIVDLVRNDLSRVCEVGSVRCPALMEVESYASVHQLVSTIEGRLAAGRSAVDAIRAAFPPGSMVGAPKIRTLSILARLEGRARGVYSGAIGFLSLSGAADLGVVIRTLVVTPRGTSIGVGGAVTLLSKPEEEFAELLVKGRDALWAANVADPAEPSAREAIADSARAVAPNV